MSICIPVDLLTLFGKQEKLSSNNILKRALSGGKFSNLLSYSIEMSLLFQVQGNDWHKCKLIFQKMCCILILKADTYVFNWINFTSNLNHRC